VIVARVRLQPTGAQVVLKPGERLIDALDERGILALPTACRAASCGICLVQVRQGAEGLAPPGKDESSLLSWLRIAPEYRLGCQIRAAEAEPVTPIDVELGPPGRRST
jgi:ferredoxin